MRHTLTFSVPGCKSLNQSSTTCSLRVKNTDIIIIIIWQCWNGEKLAKITIAALCFFVYLGPGTILNFCFGASSRRSLGASVPDEIGKWPVGPHWFCEVASHCFDRGWTPVRVCLTCSGPRWSLPGGCRRRRRCCVWPPWWGRSGPEVSLAADR